MSGLEDHLREQLEWGVSLDASTYLSGYFDGWNDALAMNESTADGPHDAEPWLKDDGQPPVVADTPQDVPVARGKRGAQIGSWWMVVWVAAIVAAACVFMLIRG